MIASVRARLTAWYAVAFACFELVFAVAGYAFVARASGARTDEELARTAAAVVDALGDQRARGALPARAVAAVIDEFRLGDAAIALLDRESGAVAITFELPDLQRAPGTPGWPLRTPPPAPPDFRAVLLAAPLTPAFVTVPAPGAPVRVYTTAYRLGARVLTVGVSRSLDAQRRTLADARAALAVGAPLMLAAAVLGGLALARRGLAPVDAMARRAAQISAGTLHERLPVADPRDELGRLATVFNGVLARLETAFERQRRFVADASHELRTPVAIIAGETELALGREARDGEALRAALVTVGHETARLQRIVDDLFLLARADAGERPRAVEELYLADLVSDVAQTVRTLAARKDITVGVRAAGDLPFRGDEALLRRLLVNLLDNAIKYTPARGTITVTAEQRGGEYRIAVADTGPGIPPEQRERVFDRFFRGQTDAGTSRPHGAQSPAGAGLGLAIARWVAEAHGGRLALTRSGPDGSTFEVVFPVPPDASPPTGARPS